MTELRAVLQGTIDAFLESNTRAVRDKEPAWFSSTLTPDCIRMYRPLSFVQRYPRVFKPVMTNSDYEAHSMVELQVMRESRQRVIRTVIDTTQGTATVWSEQTVCTMNGDTSVVELIWHLTFSQDGSRISEIMVFVDTYESSTVLEQMSSMHGTVE